MSQYVLELKNITKIFPGIKALDNVSFSLKKGEIHALMGENGAGKSTFIKTITGVHTPEEGEIFLDGKPIHFKNPLEATKHGIAAIYQHTVAYNDLSVTENIFIGHEILNPKTKSLSWSKMHKKAKELLVSLSSDIDPKQDMGSLSVAQQQIVEIAKALSINARIIIMDEPTAALTKRESEDLYKIALSLRDNGAAIIFISHRMEDMYRLASKVTVLRDSKYIGTWNVEEITNEKLIYAMVGRELTQLFPAKTATIKDKIFEVKNLSKTGYYKNISFEVNGGEIVALTGLVGAGRTEVCKSIFGVWGYDSGEIFVEGKKVENKTVWEAMSNGIGLLPEDRQKDGLVLQWGIGRNITLGTLDKYSKKSWIDNQKENQRAKELAEKVTVKAQSIFDTAASLSGGNQQKVIVAKLLDLNPKVIILDEPTKGVDVGARYSIYEIMRELCKEGFGIIMVSSDMPEVLGMADRIIVMREGRISCDMKREEATQESILQFAMAQSSATRAVKNK